MVENLWSKIKTFTVKSKRVWHALKKPSKKEFQMVAKISGIGIAILGLAGFLISVVMKMFI